MAEKNLVEIREVFADIGNVTLYDGEQRIRPEELELLPQEMTYRDADGKIAKVLGDVRMRWRKKGIVFAIMQIENQSEINNVMPIRDLGYIYNNYNEQIKEHKRKNEQEGKRFYGRELADDDRLEPFLLNHRIHLIPLQRLKEETINKYRSDFWHVIEFLSIHGRGKRRKYLEESAGRPVSHPREVMDVLYALSKDKRFLELETENDRKEEEEMGPISEMLDELELMGFERGMERGIEQGIEQGVQQERKKLECINRLTAALIKDDRTADLFRATQDPKLQEELMEEYGIK